MQISICDVVHINVTVSKTPVLCELLVYDVVYIINVTVSRRHLFCVNYLLVYDVLYINVTVSH